MVGAREPEHAARGGVVVTAETVFGDKSTVAIVVGEAWEGSRQHQHIQVWLDGHNVAAHDDVVYLPSFYGNLEREIARLEKGLVIPDDLPGLDDAAAFERLRDFSLEDSGVLAYDVTSSAARCYLAELGDDARIVYSFGDPGRRPAEEIDRVRSMPIDTDALLDTMRSALSGLSTDWT